MERIDLTGRRHTLAGMWVSQTSQGRTAVIRVGELPDGRWWVARDDGRRWTGTWVCDDQVQAEAVADRWSRRSGLRWRRAESGAAVVSP